MSDLVDERIGELVSFTIGREWRGCRLNNAGGFAGLALVWRLGEERE